MSTVWDLVQDGAKLASKQQAEIIQLKAENKMLYHRLADMVDSGDETDRAAAVTLLKQIAELRIIDGG